LLKTGVDLQLRDLNKEPLSVTELEALIGARDYLLFLNRRNRLYRERNMKDHPPSRSEALKMMAAEPNLIRRPIVISRKRLILGFDGKALKTLAGEDDEQRNCPSARKWRRP
jgi:arsenate reductase-like glutaredoxin family protein